METCEISYIGRKARPFRVRTRQMAFGILAFVAAVEPSTRPSLTHTSPARVSELGGGVLLLHGARLPYREVLMGEAVVTVGTAVCPLMPSRSDPRGDFVACGPIPAMINIPNAQRATLVHPVVLGLRGHRFACGIHICRALTRDFSSFVPAHWSSVIELS
jgi:hypothetical protein